MPDRRIQPGLLSGSFANASDPRRPAAAGLQFPVTGASLVCGSGARTKSIPRPPAGGLGGRAWAIASLGERSVRSPNSKQVTSRLLTVLRVPGGMELPLFGLSFYGNRLVPRGLAGRGILWAVWHGASGKSHWRMTLEFQTDRVAGAGRRCCPAEGAGLARGPQPRGAGAGGRAWKGSSNKCAMN
jgi:hypothetical protein